MKTAQRSQLTPEQVARYPRPGMAIPGKIRYSPDAKFVTYLVSERGDLVRDLWGLELATGQRQRWLSPPGETVTEENISHEETLRRERLRLRETGITDYLWAEKANVMLLPLRGELYRWAEGAVTRLAGGGVIDPRITDDGRRTFFVRDGDVWTIDEAGERRLTTHPAGTTNGLAEFVAQEELDRLSGYWPSPRGNLVAFEQVDESNIPVFPIVHQAKPTLEIEEHRYPFAGAENARVKLGVVSVDAGATTWMDLGNDEGYVARVDWHPDGRLLVQWLSRDWRRLELRGYDVASGAGHALLVEELEPWINLHDDLRVIESTGEFTWSSERSGFRHLYLYAPDGRLIRQLTTGEWPAEATVALDEKGRQLYFVGWQERPLDRQLYRVSLDGGGPEPLTHGSGIHGAVIAPDFSSYVSALDYLNEPPAIDVGSSERSDLLAVFGKRVKRDEPRQQLRVQIARRARHRGRVPGRLNVGSQGALRHGDEVVQLSMLEFPARAFHGGHDSVSHVSRLRRNRVFNRSLLRLFEALNRALLLLQISFVFDFRFDWLELVTNFGGQMTFRHWSALEKLRHQFTKDRNHMLDTNFGTLQELGKRLAGRGQ